MKINFTEAHLKEMKELLMKILLKNEVIYTKLGTPLNAVELLHTTSINTLNSIRQNIKNKINNLENQDEWIASTETQEELDKLKESDLVVNLIIGYKRFQMEKESIERKKEKLKAKIAQMKEEAKTPEDRLKEAEAELASLDNL